MTGPIITVTLEDGRVLRLNMSNVVGYTSTQSTKHDQPKSVVDALSGISYFVMEETTVIDARVRSAS